MSAAYSFLLVFLILERLFDPLVAIPASVAGSCAGVAVVIAAAVEAARYGQS
jgi:hypothetical protein